MTEEQENKYGKVLDETIVGEDSFHPVRVALVDQHDKIWLDIRSMYQRKSGTLAFGKGVRIDTDGELAEEALLAAQALLVKHGWMGEE